VSIHERLSSIEFVEDRRERAVPDPLVLPVAQETDADGFQRTEGKFDFAQAGVRIGQRQDGQEPEPSAVISDETGTVLVLLSREAFGLLTIAEPAS
jgi:hypothetical protein